MELKKAMDEEQYKNMTQIIDRGIEDMEEGKELPLDNAFSLIAELVEKRKRARA